MRYPIHLNASILFLYAVLINQVYRIPKCISNQNQDIQLRKDKKRVQYTALIWACSSQNMIVCHRL